MYLGSIVLTLVDIFHEWLPCVGFFKFQGRKAPILEEQKRSMVYEQSTCSAVATMAMHEL